MSGAFAYSSACKDEAEIGLIKVCVCGGGVCGWVGVGGWVGGCGWVFGCGWVCMRACMCVCVHASIVISILAGIYMYSSLGIVFLV